MFWFSELGFTLHSTVYKWWIYFMHMSMGISIQLSMALMIPPWVHDHTPWCYFTLWLWGHDDSSHLHFLFKHCTSLSVWCFVTWRYLWSSRTGVVIWFPHAAQVSIRLQVSLHIFSRDASTGVPRMMRAIKLFLSKLNVILRSRMQTWIGLVIF